MFKRIRILAFIIGLVGIALAPSTAQAQDRYFGRDGYGSYDRRERDWNRHERHEWQERQEARRAEEWQHEQWRQLEWREHEWRERQHWNRDFYPEYQPRASFYFGFRH